MPNTKEKLIELLICADDYCNDNCNKGCNVCKYNANVDCYYNVQADHLIANGVTFQTRDIHWATEQAYKNGKEAGKPKWIPVIERLPESGVHVLVACEMYGNYVHGKYVCDGFYADRYTQKVDNTDYDIACEYCEEDDEYYLWQGWYEVIKNWDDYNSVVIGDTVTHWMQLPEPPKGE